MIIRYGPQPKPAIPRAPRAADDAEEHDPRDFGLGFTVNEFEVRNHISGHIDILANLVLVKQLLVQVQIQNTIFLRTKRAVFACLTPFQALLLMQDGISRKGLLRELDPTIRVKNALDRVLADTGTLLVDEGSQRPL
jgi:hypothetical protein